MMNLSLEELMVIAKLRKVKDYKYNSKDEFKKNTQWTSIEKIRKKFNESRERFSKSKIKEITRNLYEVENKNNLST